MFVQVPFSTKGRPITFLPLTMTKPLGLFVGLPRDPLYAIVSAYWYEFKKGTYSAAYGSVAVFVDEGIFPDGFDTKGFNFDTFLDIASSSTAGRRAEFMVSRRLNGARPRFSDQSDFFPEFDDAYDPHEHALMSSFLGHMPKSSLGWFKLNR